MTKVHSESGIKVAAFLGYYHNQTIVWNKWISGKKSTSGGMFLHTCMCVRHNYYKFILQKQCALSSCISWKRDVDS